MMAILILAALVLGLLSRYSALDERRWNETAKLVRTCGPLRPEF